MSTLGKHEVAETRRGLDDPLDRPIGQPCARREIQDAQVFVGTARREGEKGSVVDELAVGQSELSQGLPLGEQVRHRLIADQTTLVKVNLEDVGAVFGKRQDGFVG